MHVLHSRTASVPPVAAGRRMTGELHLQCRLTATRPSPTPWGLPAAGRSAAARAAAASREAAAAGTPRAAGAPAAAAAHGESTDARVAFSLEVLHGLLVAAGARHEELEQRKADQVGDQDVEGDAAAKDDHRETRPERDQEEV